MALPTPWLFTDDPVLIKINQCYPFVILVALTAFLGAFSAADKTAPEAAGSVGWLPICFRRMASSFRLVACGLLLARGFKLPARGFHRAASGALSARGARLHYIVLYCGRRCAIATAGSGSRTMCDAAQSRSFGPHEGRRAVRGPTPLPPPAALAVTGSAAAAAAAAAAGSRSEDFPLTHGH